jgi:cation-transporting ATPase F
LTENQMTVRTVWTPTAQYAVSGTGYAPDGDLRDASGGPACTGTDQALRWSLLAGAACNDAALVHDGARWGIVGDPTEAAMLVVAAKAGLETQQVRETLPRVASVPFASERGYMATLHDDLTADGSGGRVVLAKGAAERLLDLCSAQLGPDGSVTPVDRPTVLAAAADLAGSGMRVLATALGTTDLATHAEEDFENGRAPGRLTLTGLQALIDPPRAAAAAAVKACRTAGISVKMITGDHAATATAIAGQVGLIDHGAGARVEGLVLTGPHIAATASEDLPEAVDRAAVLARVSPEQKLRLVEALQARGHVVAMTGDGVNDAPALRRANIGVAMGRSGTEVAKDAADMILTDDDFATIEAAIEEGRGVFDNLTKFITWTLPTNIGEGLVILAAIVAGAALPILPTQILWINMTTAVALGLMLAFEPKEPGIMRRPPRDPQQPLLTRALMLRILLVSSLLVAGSWWLFEWELANGAMLPEARTAAVNLFVVVEAFYLFSCRSLTQSPWRIGPFSNRWIVVGVTAQALGQLAITYLPAMNRLFGTAPIDIQVWLRILAIATLASLVVAVDKRLRRPS